MARLVPILPEAAPDERVSSLARHGLVRLGTRRVPDGFRDTAPPMDRGDAALQALLREREDGR